MCGKIVQVKDFVCLLGRKMPHIPQMIRFMWLQVSDQDLLEVERHSANASHRDEDPHVIHGADGDILPNELERVSMQQAWH